MNGRIARVAYCCHEPGLLFFASIAAYYTASTNLVIDQLPFSIIIE
jgi:hypothetical protein